MSFSQLGHCDDVAGMGFRNLLERLALHHVERAKSFVGVFGYVVNSRVGLDLPGVNLEHIDAASERIGHRLENQSENGATSLTSRSASSSLSGLGWPFHGSELVGGRHKLDNCSQKRLYSYVLCPLATRIGNSLRSVTACFIPGIKSASLSVPSAKYFSISSSELSATTSMIFSRADCGCFQVSRYVAFRGLTAAVLLVCISAHVNQVYDSLKAAFAADRNLKRHCCAPKSFVDARDGLLKVRALAVHLCDHDQPRKIKFVGVAPAFFGLHFDAVDRIDQHQGRIAGSSAALASSMNAANPGVSNMLIFVPFHSQ